MKTSGRKTIKASTTSAPRASKLADTSTSSAGASAAIIPTAEQISKRAYELFLARGGADGHDAEDWIQAESELLAR